jgi:PASTA domain
MESGRGPSTDYRAGTVSRQDPPPNAPIPKNRLVRYWLAQGPSQTVPSIMGRSAQDANAILGQYNLRGTESGRGTSTDYQPGTVSRQDPSPNAPIPKNRLIRYRLAQEPQRVPSILGSSPQDVNTILGQHGLRGIESGREPSTAYQPGTVSRQDPPANALIPRNKRVSYFLAEETQVSPSPWDWKRFLQNVRLRTVDIILGALVASGVVALIVSKWYDGRRHPKVEVLPVKDYGEQHVAPRPPALAVELYPVLDPGDQALDKVDHLIEQRGGQWTSNLQR